MNQIVATLLPHGSTRPTHWSICGTGKRAFFLNVMGESGLGAGGGNCHAYLHRCADDVRRYSYHRLDGGRPIEGWGPASVKSGERGPQLNARKAAQQRADEGGAGGAGGSWSELLRRLNQ